MILSTGAPQYVCCFCGVNVYAQVISEAVTGHGRYLPYSEQYRTRIAKPEGGECPMRPPESRDPRNAPTEVSE